MAELKINLSDIIAQSGPDVAKALLLQLGHSEEEASAKITESASAVAEARAKTRLDGFRDAMKSAMLDFAPADIIPEDMDRFEVILDWTKEERKEANDQIIPPGFYVKAIKAKTDDMDKMVSLFRGARHKSSGGGNGGTPVPSDAPFTSWKTYVVEHTNYDSDPDNAPANGEDRSNYCPVSNETKSYAATLGLKKVGDDLYLECARIKKEENRQATWEEVKEYA